MTPSVILQAYPDHVKAEAGVSSLAALTRFVGRFGGAIDAVHLLPPYLATGDFGFAVQDYTTVEGAFGTWDDIEALSTSTTLILDFVVNHVSASHPWFTRFLANDDEVTDFFIRVDASWDLSKLARPRAGLPVSQFSDHTGRPVDVWTSYSRGQIDVNYRSPRLLTAMADELTRLVERTGAAVRLDSLAFAWKEPGSLSIHADGTFDVARQLVAAARRRAPGNYVIAEVDDDLAPHLDYRRRTGADAAYRYALPPLIAHTLLAGDSAALRTWLAALPAGRQPSGINITATHDGLYLRPHDPPLPAAAVDALAARAQRCGGGVQVRNGAVYELNTTFGSLLADSGATLDRHIAAQAIALTLPGVTQIYLPSLFALPYDPELAREHGEPRAGGRAKHLDVAALLAEPRSPAARCFRRMAELLDVRARHPRAFRPEAAFALLDTPPGILGFTRGSGLDTITVLVNVTDEVQPVPHDLHGLSDLLSRAEPDTPHTIRAYGLRWLTTDHGERR
ncbi:sucrose phosphorylase [Streptomyces sp. 2224.1]|uniref:alpha-amylase family glycosyl hydrolase n=1 Tax=unclassified Streptomyces TaxID=2593676 RepID=UPI000887C81C|nr:MULTISPECIES: alpha-amylase family glycosyl hydrolase [unclassified Streptomyces]PBC82469.1 sucrose phosphorylase [Streptomyces sp. 2321.6]SDR49490.1 sucrose phosphorylase [Streptomyces sp. KS_16]SEC45328.1 sucrose phosphorylase [Streptomyces sp. 2224.1]SEC59153.1 sucrose phosphorylase [Streptomyces sp. 2133.1]SNC68466.1 sucrose phosphorylase [Streptomyces sp. 2114.4]